jgi:hypothetical protein
MKTLVFGLIAAGTLGFAAPGTATAGDPHHGRYHDELEHRDFHRDLDHRQAHRYPMTWRQHGRLHDELEHDAYHDRLEHRSYHRYRPPYYRIQPHYGGYGTYYRNPGFGISGRGFSLWLGR